MNDTLPLPDYDETGLPQLQHDIRALSAAELDVLLEHERNHANRTPVLEVLVNRRDQLAAGAEPSEGDPGAESSRPGDSSSGSPVSPGGASGPSERPRTGVDDQNRG